MSKGSKGRRTEGTFLHSNLSCALLDTFAILCGCFLLLLLLCTLVGNLGIDRGLRPLNR